MRFVKRVAALAVVLGLVVTGCSDGGQSGSAAGGSGDTVVFGGPGGATGELFRAAIADFQKETGINVTYQEGAVQEVYSKVLAGAQAHRPDIDVYYANDATSYTGKSQGLYQALDTAALTNADKLAPDSLPSDKIGVTIYGTLEVLVYNTDLLKQNNLDPPTSWSDMWNPAYTKCGLVLAEPHGSAREWYMMNDVSSNGDMYNFETTLAKIAEVEKRGEITSIVESAQNVSDDVAAGKGCIGAVNQGKVLDSISNGAPIDFAIPKEGTAALYLYLQLVSDAPHADAGNKLINYFLGTSAQQRFYEKGGETPVNKDVTKATSGPAARITLFSDMGDTKLLVPDPEKSDLDGWLKQFQDMVAR